MQRQYKATGNGASRSGQQRGNNEAEMRVLHNWKYWNFAFIFSCVTSVHFWTNSLAAKSLLPDMFRSDQ